MHATPLFRDQSVFEIPQQVNEMEPNRRTNRRRLVVFLIVFSVTLLPGLAWNLLRPAEYRANARVQITMGTVSPRINTTASGSNAGDPPGQRIDLLTQVQILNSRSLLEEVHHRLAQEGLTNAFPGPDPVAELQNVISASPISGTDIVELQAIGSSPQRLAKIVNMLIDTYREQLFASHGSESRDAIVNLRDEVDRLGISVTEKRAQLASFRERSGVVSSERSENVALARIKGLSESLNRANEEAAKAEARLRTLRDSAASGKSPVFSRDNPTLASIEQRVSTTREQLRDMERVYTPDFMAMDPTARALRARLSELEKQLSSNRLASQQAMLSASEEELGSTRALVERLRGQIEAQRREAQIFSGNFHEAQALEDDLARLEGTRRNATERLAKLEASENARLPTLKLIEAASVPQQPWRPDYLRDALFNLLGSFLAGLLAMWFVELFNRSASSSPSMPTTILVSQPWMAPALGMEPPLPIAERTLGRTQPVPQLSVKADLPRELTQDEVGALLAGADSDDRLLCTLLLMGLTVDELSELTIRDFDLEGVQLRVRGASARTLTMPGWLVRPLAKYTGDDIDRPVFRNSVGQPLSESDIGRRLACAALDAGLDAATSVSPDVLRHTYIAFLMRQNVRFSGLAPLVGTLNAEELAAYADASPSLQRVRHEEIDPIMPALRGAAA